ncbi:DUF3267 domain-containing protein [Staphylococcus pasteuri]
MKQFSQYMIISFIGFGLIFWLIEKSTTTKFLYDSAIINILSIIILYILIFTIHECIHGIFFKLFSPHQKVHFGYSSGMIYCAIPGGQFTPMTFLISAIAPFMIITMILIIALYSGVLPKFLFLFFATFHAGSCVGDFYWVIKMIQAPKNSTIETTDEGIIIHE